MSNSRTRAVLVLAVALVGAVAQPCCMWCPNGAQVGDTFQPHSTAVTGDGGKELDVSSAQWLQVAVMDFNVPPLPTVTNPNVTSTLFSAIMSAWGADTFSAIALLTFDPNYVTPSGSVGSYAVQALIQKNGHAVATGTKNYTPPGPGHAISVTHTQPNDAPGSAMSVTIADPFTGFSQVQMAGFPTTAPDTNSWQIGWGWSGTGSTADSSSSSSAPNCALFPPGDGVVLTDLSATGGGEWYVLNFTNTNTLQPFCGITASYEFNPSIGFGSLIFNYTRSDDG